jgi:aminoglycoside phosphotransferase (APT) family kinase protein
MCRSGIITKFWGGILPRLSDLLDSRDALGEEGASQPAVLVHGDCHTGNIVHAADGLVFGGWQSAGVGRATSDLAMLGVRAAPSGAAVPRNALTAYLNRRSYSPNDSLSTFRAARSGAGRGHGNEMVAPRVHLNVHQHSCPAA